MKVNGLQLPAALVQVLHDTQGKLSGGRRAVLPLTVGLPSS
jgi:hypothetical protein